MEYQRQRAQERRPCAIIVLEPGDMGRLQNPSSDYSCPTEVWIRYEK
jgi:hypothetical protein